MTSGGSGCAWSPITTACVASVNGRVEPRLVVVSHFEHGFTRRHLFAGLLAQQDAGGQIDLVAFLVAAGAKRHRGAADEQRVERR